MKTLTTRIILFILMFMLIVPSPQAFAQDSNECPEEDWDEYNEVCATESNMDPDTEVGMGVGAILGGIAGGLLCALTGSRKLVAACALAGAALGGYGGKKLGEKVTETKVAFAEEEARLDALIARTKEDVELSSLYQSTLKGQITELKSEIAQLTESRQQGTEEKSVLENKKVQVAKLRMSVQEDLQTLETEHEILAQIYADSGGDKKKKLDEAQEERKKLTEYLEKMQSQLQVLTAEEELINTFL